MNGHSSSSLQRVVTIRTPENIELTYSLAGPGTRAAAYLVDLLVMYLLLSVLQNLILLVLAPVVESTTGGAAWVVGLLVIVGFVLYSGYFLVFEWLMNGQTPGKRLLGIRVIKEGGYALRFLDSLIRNLLRIVDFLPFGYGVGLASVLLTARSQRLGDLAAGTLLVHQQQVSAEVMEPAIPQAADQPELPLERLRAVPEGLINLVVHFFQVLPELGPRARQQIAGELVDLLRATSGLTPGPTQSAEAFLAAVVQQTERASRS